MTEFERGFYTALRLVKVKQTTALFRNADCVKPDEAVICTNATVLMDGNGELSWVSNDSEIIKL